MSATDLLHTPLAALHIELGARMVPFAGYSMPVQYPSGLVAEHHALHSRFMLGDTHYSDEQRRAITPASWPLVQTDPHSPRHLRVLGPLSNMDSFRDAFGLPDDAPALRPREERIEIW